MFVCFSFSSGCFRGLGLLLAAFYIIIDYNNCFLWGFFIVIFLLYFV